MPTLEISTDTKTEPIEKFLNVLDNLDRDPNKNEEQPLNDEEDAPSNILTDRTGKDKSTRVDKNHPTTNIIRDPLAGI